MLDELFRRVIEEGIKEAWSALDLAPTANTAAPEPLTLGMLKETMRQLDNMRTVWYLTCPSVLRGTLICATEGRGTIAAPRVVTIHPDDVEEAQRNIDKHNEGWGYDDQGYSVPNRQLLLRHFREWRP